jgi:hypothetical protein
LRLFHVSEEANIDKFEPRQPPTTATGIRQPVVWAIDEDHLVNYLLPRDCPRVTFYPLPQSTTEDIIRFVGASGASKIVCIEAAWLQRASEQPLWLYELPVTPFEQRDGGAGYYISAAAVIPLRSTKIERPLQELAARGAELRILPSLLPTRDAVIRSTLQFSCIRMRNAGLK